MKDDKVFDVYELKAGKILKNGAPMYADQIVEELNAKANPKPEEVRVSLGSFESIAKLWFRISEPLVDIPMKLSNGEEVEFTHVTGPDGEWIEIEVPDGVKEFLYSDAVGFNADFRAGFNAAREVKP